MEADQRELHARVTITTDGNQSVYEDDSISSIDYDGGAMSGEQFVLGTTFSNSVKIVLKDVVKTIKQLDTVKVELGINTGNSIEYVSLGVFVVSERVDADENENQTTIETMDRFIMMEGDYVSKLSYPAKLNDIALEIANLSAIAVNTTDFARIPTTMVAKIEGKTYRQAIGIVAQFVGGFATFDRNGLLSVRKLNNTDYQVTPDMYFLKGLKKNDLEYRVGGIQVRKDATSDDEDNLHAGDYKGTQIQLENPIMTQSLLNGLYAAIKDLNFYPFTLDWRGDPAVEVGDWIQMVDNQGNIFKGPVLNQKLTYNGGLKSTSSADTEVESSVTYQSSGPISQVIKHISGLINERGNVINYGADTPVSPKEGDVWFKKNGPDDEIWIYKNDQWIVEMNNATKQDVIDAIENNKKEIETASQDASDALKNAADATNRATAASSDAQAALSNAQTAFDKATDASTKANAATNEISSVKQTVQGIQTTVQSKADKSEVTQLAGVVNTKVSNDDFESNNIQTAKLIQSTVENVQVGGANYLYDSNFKSLKSSIPSGQTRTGWRNSTTNGSLKEMVALSNDIYAYALHLIGNGAGQHLVAQDLIPCNNGDQFILSGYYKTKLAGQGIQVQTGQGGANDPFRRLEFIAEAANTWQKFEFQIKTTVNGFTGVYLGAHISIASEVWFANVKFEKGNKATDWSENDEFTSSSITQLADNISLKVSQGDVINQINISPESILIAGKKIQITGDTFIGNGVIKTAHIGDGVITNAKIGTLSANKITTGILNAENVNIINLNASNITTGQLVGISITSTAKTGLFNVEGQNAVFQNTSTNRRAEINETGINIYNANGTLRAQFNQNVVNTGIVGTNTTNVYVGTGGVDGVDNEKPGGELRVVAYDSTPGSGTVTDYSFRPVRAEGFVGNYINVNTPFPQFNHLYLRPRNGIGEVRITGSGTIDSYQSLRAKGVFADTFDSNSTTAGVNVYIRPASSGEVRFTKIDTTDTYMPIRSSIAYVESISQSQGTNFYIGTDGEMRVTSRGMGGNDPIVYRDLRASVYRGIAMDTTATHLYLRATSGGGEVRATQNGTTGTYIPIRASAFTTSSLAEYKTAITPFNEDALSIINKSTIFEYFLKNNLQKREIGLVIGENYNAPSIVIDGDGISQYRMNSLSWKAIQELYLQVENLEEQIKQLQSA